MEGDKNFTFEEIFKQNENRIHYHIHKLGIRDPYREYYVEGIYAMWMAYKKYQPDKGPMSTYFNFIIRNRLIDMIRKEERSKENDESVKQAESVRHLTGNWNKGTGSLPNVEGIVLGDEGLLDEIRSVLTGNQMKWVTGFVMEGLTVRELAEREGVSEDAVKGWGRQARMKLRKLLG